MPRFGEMMCALKIVYIIYTGDSPIRCLSALIYISIS